MSDEPDKRSALSIGMEWSSRITTIGLEFALPAVVGFGLDRWWGTSPWLTVAGSLLGVAVGMFHVLRLASRIPGSRPRPQPRHPGSNETGTERR